MDYTEETVPTPALVVDMAKAQHNIDKMQAYVDEHGMKLRPHTKTHKSLLMSQAQLKAGAAGLTVAKVGEGEVMQQAGNDMLLAYPALDPARTGRIAELAKKNTMRVAVDSSYAVKAIASETARAGVEVGILVDIDYGFHRTGVQTIEEALEIAQVVEKTPGVHLDGIFTYPGHIAYKYPEQIKPLAEGGDKIAAGVELFKKHGLNVGIVSSASTPTAFQTHLVPSVTEMRPGTYIYYDRNCYVGQWCTLDECAAMIVATVVSTAVPDKCVLDCGNKTLTSDLCLGIKENGYGMVVEYPEARISRLSEEHGEVELHKCEKRPKLGDRVHVLINHICPCVNLQDIAWLKDTNGTLEPLPIDARGKLS